MQHLVPDPHGLSIAIGSNTGNLNPMVLVKLMRTAKTSDAQVAFWEKLFEQIVEQPDWKKDLESSLRVPDFRRSKDVIAYLDSEYTGMRALPVALGMITQ